METNKTYALLLSGTITKDLSEPIHGGKRILYKAKVELLPLAENELEGKTIERLLVNRLSEKREVFMCEEPKRFEKKIFAVEKRSEGTFLFLVLRGIF